MRRYFFPEHSKGACGRASPRSPHRAAQAAVHLHVAYPRIPLGRVAAGRNPGTLS